MLSLVDYSKMAEEFSKKADAVGMQRMQKTDKYADADVAELAADGSFAKIHPKPHTEQYPNAYRMKGIFILKKDILGFIPKDTFYELGKNLLPEVVNSGKKFYSYECEDYSKGIDTEDKWKEVEAYLKTGGR